MNVLLQLIKRARRIILNCILIEWEIGKYKKYCRDGKRKYSTIASIERDILVAAHTLEKGFSHKNIKPLFGKIVVDDLLNNLNIYKKSIEADEFVLNWGVAVLKKYLEINIRLGVSKDELFVLPSDLQKYEHCDAGAFECNLVDVYNTPLWNFADLVKARHSVRLYDNLSDVVEDEEIIKCIKIAQLAPSACNRQATRVYIVKNKEYIKNISDIQGGSKGFGENADALLCIIADLRFYTIAERRLPILDAGLFMMTLVYALFSNGIGSCILNASFSSKQEKKFNEFVSLQPYELLVGMVAINKISKDQTILLTNSARRKTESIFRFVR